ncbi:hypothetical protein L484_003057 [Morus notabilis]|uniref:Uncharacterized protein n=1 Tax=Morus notabilis TaxID=981085 RepID=W9RBH4_9ROSA|nr:hypothetical protein L484_003057 [Morus notabilis]
MDACPIGVEGTCSWTRHLTIGPLVGIKHPVAFWDSEELFMENENCNLISYNLHTQKLSDCSIRANWLSDRLVKWRIVWFRCLERRGKKLNCGEVDSFRFWFVSFTNSLLKEVHDNVISVSSDVPEYHFRNKNFGDKNVEANPSVGGDSSDEGDDPSNDGASDLGNTSGGARTRVRFDGCDLQRSSPSRVVKELLTLLLGLKLNISGVGLALALFKEEEDEEFF